VHFEMEMSDIIRISSNRIVVSISKKFRNRLDDIKMDFPQRL
jgi:hypothetical protein